MKVSRIDISSVRVPQQSNFSEVIAKEKARFPMLTEKIETFCQDWANTDKVVALKSSKLDGAHKALFDSQLLVSRVVLQTELLVKSAEGVSATVRKLQQFNQ